MKTRLFGDVTVALTTFPPRLDRAINVLRTLWPQCDHLRACFNGFETEPLELLSFLHDIESDITEKKDFKYVLANDKNGIRDLGCNNKMYWIDECDGYYVTVDDDIIYPNDYVEKMVAAVDRHNGKAVCVVHGNIFLPKVKGGPIIPNNSNKVIIFYSDLLKEDVKVHLGGMGTGICVPKIIGLKWSLFNDKKNSGDDEKVSLHCLKNKIPIFSIKRPKWFLKSNEVKTYCLCTDQNSRKERIEMLQNYDWKPLFNNSINVCYLTDGAKDNEKQLAVSILSLIKNSYIPVNIYVMYNCISDALNDCLLFYRKNFNANIKLIKIENALLEKCVKYNQKTIEMGKSVATSIALSKFEISNILPNSVSNVLYLDSDTIVERSLHELAWKASNNFNLPILSAVKEKATIKIDYDKHPYHKYEDYFNSGVMFMNLYKFRKENIPNELWKAKKISEDQQFTDQSAFNMVFHKKVDLMVQRYNAVCYKEQKEDSFIFHFCGHKKPINDNTVRYASKWFFYWDEIKEFFDETKKPKTNISTNELTTIEKPKAKICIITAATDNLAYQYNVTNNIKQKYCNLHGYDYKFINLNMEKKKAFHARKDLLVEYMDEYEWVMWMDTDAWFNNFDISLESIIKKYADKNTDLIIARDHGVLGSPSKYHDCFVNSGILLFRSCEDSKKMISLWKNPPEYAKEWMLTATKLNDQPFLSIRILWDSYYSERTKVVPAEEFNYFAHLKGDQTNVFILHAPGKKDENWYVKKFERMVEPTLERLKHYDFKKKEQKKVVEEVPAIETKIEKKQSTDTTKDVKKTNINMGSKKDLTLMDIVAETSEKVKPDGAVSLVVSKSNKNALKYKKMENGWKP